MTAILILSLLSIAFCAFLIAISHFFGPKERPSAGKAEGYECGIAAPAKAGGRVPVQFFLTAILFIIFDIEIIFLYPFALAYRDLLQTDYGAGALLAMGLFILLFIYGLWWEIKTRALDWK